MSEQFSRPPTPSYSRPISPEPLPHPAVLDGLIGSYNQCMADYGDPPEPEQAVLRAVRAMIGPGAALALMNKYDEVKIHYLRHLASSAQALRTRKFSPSPVPRPAPGTDKPSASVPQPLLDTQNLLVSPAVPARNSQGASASGIDS